jgi:hypothetical protein
VVDVDGKKVPIEEFNQAFDVWITEEAPDGTVDFDMAKSLPVFTGKLDPEKNSDGIYYLVVKMKESVGNEFQGKSYAGIGVTVYAVQGNVEKY